MKPLPAQTPVVIKPTDSAMPSLPSALPNPAPSYSKANRRASSSCPTQRAYPWLLFASTGIAAMFCLMYITKPVILASQGEMPAYNATPVTPMGVPVVAVKSSLMPDQNRLPGEGGPAHSASASPGENVRNALSQSKFATAFEQTNLRIQHILTAEAPGGHLAKIDLDVPVLYQSRNLRWTAPEVAEARELLARLADYQEKSRALRSEGVALLDSWNHLVERSIPNGELRADSPTLPTNQQDAVDAPRPIGLDTTESIQIKPSGK
ncbi:MAG: hypothetical protein ABIS50_02220 [Luteolibacter sp.]|uniref:hypothetical protein n=1 Tax=Luteolibacter sp. TaxID=1962973 RepID=UPI0032664116